MDPMQGVFHGMDIATSGMRAELQRAEVVAANISNMHVTGGKTRDPYRRRSVVFEELIEKTRGALAGVEGGEKLASGVQVKRVVEDTATPFVPRYDPQDPEAKDGWVLGSNVDLFRELVDMSIIERSFEANLVAMRSYRGMVQSALTNISRT